ncbi:MAG: hydantoinase B/oxoprolinase family protein [Candidatus Hodarchaeota archaeon]
MVKKLDPILIEILWNRLIGITDEVAITLLRTCFSSIIRDCHDYSIALFDDQKRFLAQFSTSAPAQVGCMPATIENFCRVFPPETLEDGDVLITNDPWKAIGHLNDITIVSPIFYWGKLVGFALCTVHHVDIGGHYATLESEEIFEEGLWIPICKIHKAGVPNEDLFNVIRHNVRVPDQVVGDIRAQLAANHLSSKRVKEFLEEYGLENLRELGDEIISRSEEAIRKQIRKIPDGTYTHSIDLDGWNDEQPRLSVAVHISGDRVVVDFEGTSRQVHRAINSVFNCTYAEVIFVMKSILDPFIPNNLGCLHPITLKAPEGSLVNPKWPAPLWGRTIVIHQIPDLIYGALSKAIPDRVIAESGSAPLGSIGITSVKPNGEHCLSLSFFFGGLGGRSTGDGICCVAFPCNVSNTPVELVESQVPILWEKRELVCDSGGPGKFRGGCGQEFVFSVPSGNIGPMENEPVFVSVRGGRFERPCQGILGGKNSSFAKIFINDGQVKLTKPRFSLKPGDTLRYIVPGGGGYRDALDRDPYLVREDVRNSLVSIESAKIDYGVIISREGFKVDEEATNQLRLSKKNTTKKAKRPRDLD